MSRSCRTRGQTGVDSSAQISEPTMLLVLLQRTDNMASSIIMLLIKKDKC